MWKVSALLKFSSAFFKRRRQPRRVASVARRGGRNSLTALSFCQAFSLRLYRQRKSGFELCVTSPCASFSESFISTVKKVKIFARFFKRRRQPRRVTSVARRSGRNPLTALSFCQAFSLRLHRQRKSGFGLCVIAFFNKEPANKNLTPHRENPCAVRFSLL